MSMAQRRVVAGSLLFLGACLACSSGTSQKGDAGARKGDAGTDHATTFPDAEIPTDGAPATDAPATDVPATDVPATDGPGTDAPGTDVPGTDAPRTDAPGTDAPRTDAPATDGPGTDAAPPLSHSVLQRGNHISRDGLFIQPTLTKAAVARFGRDFSFTAYFNGQQWSSPLYFENGPGGKGIVVAVGTANDVVAFDETTAKAIWTRNIGPAAAATGAGCGNIAPIGILSTPVIDASSRTLYVAGAVGQQAIERHEIHALSLDDGSERPGWPLDVAKVTAGNAVPFMAPYQNQRGALSLVGGILYVPYGGHIGDCGPYHGWVVAVDVKDPTKVGAWATGGKGEAIWAAGGMASDGNGVFAVTGNNTSGVIVHLDSEEVVRITGLGVLDRKDQNVYYPARWKDLDQHDADMGSSSSLYLEVPGATPSSYVVAMAKDGHMYLLDSKNLGGMGGEVADLQVGVGTGHSLWAHPAAYTTAQGVHVVFGTDYHASCPGGVDGGFAMVSVLIPPGAPPVPKVVWCAPRGGSGAPIVTTTDGRNDAVVWFLDRNTLTALDGDTGQVLYTGANTSCGNVRQWTTPIAAKGRIFTGIDGAICAWGPQPASQPDAATGN